MTKYLILIGLLLVSGTAGVYHGISIAENRCVKVFTNGDTDNNPDTMSLKTFFKKVDIDAEYLQSIMCGR